ncbi:MAG: hypothetical protein HY028_09155 [Gammaproteobacteria bacterium]|nr:hypothetical protein [Gammaproteobacteria bacterium]
MSQGTLTADAELEELQHASFNYFLHETNPVNGLGIDKTEADWPASIAATGLALAAYPVGVERGFMPRDAAVERSLATLRFFWNSPQGPEPDATGYQGFYYHFLDMQTGRRAWQVAASLPFAPEIVLPVLDYCIHDVKLIESNRYGFKASFNPTYPAASGNPHGWVSPWHFGLNEGPTVLMIENYHTGLLWQLMRRCPYIVGGLRRADFTGGWL